ncbi:hypothetical protein PQR36_08475 [Paraburkholderia nemoris]|uniref:hypothetical protein n=1 Tax=Paraburkholderia nemoris TaxID=2793076 RepID=UPI0038B90C44
MIYFWRYSGAFSAIVDDAAAYRSRGAREAQGRSLARCCVTSLLTPQGPASAVGKRSGKAMHLNGARRAHVRRIGSFIGAIFHANFIRMCASVRMELA